MISEPEMEGEPGPAEPVDLVSHTDRPPSPGRSGSKPWLWALGAVVVTSAVWAGVLQGTGYGRDAAPDLHGYRVKDTPCTNGTMQPLAGDLGSVSFVQLPAKITTSTALDHISCELIGTAQQQDGWTTTYTIAVSVELHKKTDPTAEFDALSRSEVPAPSGGAPDAVLVYLDDSVATTHPQDLGDRANLVAGQYRQSLYVRHGGAVFSLTLLGTNEWDTGLGKMPTTPDGAATRPNVADTTGFRKDLGPTMRSLMNAMVAPPSS